MSIISPLRQVFPGKPHFTEKDVPDLKNKVIVVTGANSGVGKELAQILYAKNAKVYMLARSESKTKAAIDSIKAAVPMSSGDMIFIPLDLADLPSINVSANELLRREQKIHLLFNNAGVGYPEKGSKTKQGYELQVGVNCIGAFALTKLLTQTIVATAKASPPNTVRVVWVSSSAAEGANPNTFMASLPDIQNKGSAQGYFASKLGNYFHATEFAARHKEDGIMSIPLNPGNLDSDFWRSQGPILTYLLQKTVLFPPKYGAYTALFAGFSPQVTPEMSGHFVAPWGRFWNVSKQMIAASKSKSEGGTGVAADFWKWTDDQVQLYI
ncbi:NAD(P)-binding protein [Hypoxylon fragiforme]|uniref:NAD(P)-binding protein n=1 Tax=Hypoxylon fragiforme TaxID=63214 RepID=UPI0020C68955|nr:NAD(P)-binding protein [Hypoxylon fragiforme]KAI2611375.1 NAD(P)-binding protein [Hypoxylon fragiforme]